MISADIVAFTFREICKSIALLHAKEIIHRDIKPENMFFSEDLQKVIMIDFGSSEDLTRPELRKQVHDPKARRNSHVNFVGTP